MAIFAGNVNIMNFHHLSLDDHSENPYNDMREGRLHLVTIGILALTTYGATVGSRNRVVKPILLEQEEKKVIEFSSEQFESFMLTKNHDKFVNALNANYEKVIVSGNLSLSDSPITSLPNNLHVEGYLDLRSCEQLTSLPDNLHVEGGLDLIGTRITNLPENYFDPQVTADLCNERNKVIILHPHYCMTIVPLSIHGDRNDMGNEEMMRKHIREALMANEVSSRVGHVLFDLHPHDDFDWRLANRLLQEEAPRAPFVHTRKLTWIDPGTL